MVVLGLTCLFIGVLLHVAGRSSDDLTVARIGAYMFVIGIVLVATRLFYWVIENMVGRGLESMHHCILSSNLTDLEEIGREKEVWFVSLASQELVLHKSSLVLCRRSSPVSPKPIT